MRYRRVKKFPSASTPGKIYYVSINENQELSCDCPGWTLRVSEDGSRTCKHVRQVRVEMKATGGNSSGWFPILDPPSSDFVGEKFNPSNVGPGFTVFTYDDSKSQEYTKKVPSPKPSGFSKSSKKKKGVKSPTEPEDSGFNEVERGKGRDF